MLKDYQKYWRVNKISLFETELQSGLVLGILLVMAMWFLEAYKRKNLEDEVMRLRSFETKVRLWRRNFSETDLYTQTTYFHGGRALMRNFDNMIGNMEHGDKCFTDREKIK